MDCAIVEKELEELGLNKEIFMKALEKESLTRAQLKLRKELIEFFYNDEVIGLKLSISEKKAIKDRINSYTLYELKLMKEQLKDWNKLKDQEFFP